MKNVISSEKIRKHNIEPYRFKILSSFSNTNDKEKNDVQIKDEEEKNKIKEDKNELKNEPTQENAPTKPMVEDAFVEKLLEKTDELSSNIIKLQMQIESQEEEFDNRLKEETSRAKEDGLKEGYEKAHGEYEKSLHDLQSQYLRSVSILDKEYKNFKEFVAKSEEELSQVAIDVAQEVVQKEINIKSSEVAFSLAKSLMKDLEDATKIELKVNIDDYENIKESLKDAENIKITPDDAISKGGVIVISDVGNIDGSIKKRLEKIEQMSKE